MTGCCRTVPMAIALVTVSGSCSVGDRLDGPRSDADGAPSAAALDVAESIAMVDIPGGVFVMGTEAADGFQNGTPPHRVALRGFRMSRTEITFAQYDAYARETGRELPPDETWGRGRRPVIHVSWSEVQGFIDWLNAATGRRFRLPTEAEWEYAARGGTTSLYWWGDEVDHTLVNNSVDDGRDVWQYTAPVGEMPPNPYGLLDILGNVWELVADCRHPDYIDAPADGTARLDGDCDSRIARGGSWGSTSRGVQVAARGAAAESFSSMDLGFRLVESAGE
jgi:formylglycine-generating enzyme required for sulfatase activity